EALLKLGMAQYRQDRPADARATFTRLLDEHPDSGRALHAVFERGQALVALKQDAEAAADFARVLKEGPQSRFAAYAANHLGAIALRRGEHAAAAAQFARVLEHKPERDLAADALLQQGRALLAGGKYAEAEKALARFLEQHGAHPQAATAAAQRAIATARQDRPADALKLIEALAESKATAELAGALQSAVQYEQAWCLRKLGRNEEAAQAYRAVVDGPADAAQRTHALLELAEIEAAAGRCAAAIPLLTRLLESAAAESAGLSSELRVVAAYRLGICQFETAGFEAAAATLGDLLKKNLRDDLAASAGYFCGEARFRLGRHVDAVESFGRVAESFKDDAVWPASVLRLGECLAELQRWERSERAYADFLRAQPAHEQAYKAQFGLGWARENMGRHDEAIAAYRVVVERHPGPTAARAQFQIGECLFAKKQYDEAARELLKVDILYAYPEWSAAALFEAGRCFEQLGKAVEARRQFEAVREKHGKTRWAELAAQRLAASGGDGLPGRGTTSAAP
ncbi:MAG: tetratricopeptide repeat protein, partial [Planctomycetota bacterium]